MTSAFFIGHRPALEELTLVEDSSEGFGHHRCYVVFGPKPKPINAQGLQQ